MNVDPSLHSVILELENAYHNQDQALEGQKTPEQEELEKALARQARIQTAADSAQMAVDDMDLEILRIQEDERKFRRRVDDNRKQLTAELDPEKRKDLEYDLYAAKSRIADLMSELKECHNEISALRNNRDVHGAQVDEAARQVELARRAAESANAAVDQPNPQQLITDLRAQLPMDVMEALDARRESTGVGAAAFTGGFCGACFLEIPAADRAAIKAAPPEMLPECPNCGAFLIRQLAA